MSENKTRHGQFYTLRSPFTHPLFQEWMAAVEKAGCTSFVEPFAGANNIPRSVMDAFPWITPEMWTSCDVEPEAITVNQVPEITLIENDSLDSPVSGEVIITNPPYLAKNSARRMGLEVDFGPWGDLWEVSMEMCLSSASYVAAIIPESFLTRGLFRERLMGVVSITENLFDDTEFPVCLAMWMPAPTPEFDLWVGERHLGTMRAIAARTSALGSKLPRGVKVRYNDPNGPLGLKAVDSTTGPSITYCSGETIPSTSIKVSSRAITRLDILNGEGESLIQGYSAEELSSVVDSLNELLREYREQSGDVFLTSFKGMRRDGVYRRRMDWATSNSLIAAWLEENGDIMENDAVDGGGAELLQRQSLFDHL